MTQNIPEDDALDFEITALLEEAAAQAPVPSAALLARIADDAQSTQAALLQKPIAQPYVPTWRQWLSEIGGMPVLGGLAVSACVGVYIGFANPQLTQSVQSFAGLDVISSSDDPFGAPLLGDLDWIEEG